jgi:hypothetical protein
MSKTLLVNKETIDGTIFGPITVPEPITACQRAGDKLASVKTLREEYEGLVFAQVANPCYRELNDFAEYAVRATDALLRAQARREEILGGGEGK